MSGDPEPAATRDPALARVTLRAALTGMSLGAALTLCNIYTGLKVGWGTNMSIIAVLLGYALWVPLGRVGVRPFGILENNLSQTAASAAATISSAGLVAAIPALTLLTGQTLGLGWLSAWVFVVSLLGIVVGIALRRQLIEIDRLPFPMGLATAETLREIYGRGSEAVARVRALVASGVVAALVKVAEEIWKLPKLALPFAFAGKGALAARGVAVVTFKNLGLALEPTLLMFGMGGLIGPRASLSVLAGAVVAWGGIAPVLLERGWVTPGKPDAIWFGPLVQWLLWPGVGLMVTASLTSFALSAKSIVRSFSRVRVAGDEARPAGYDIGRRTLGILVPAVVALAVGIQLVLFRIGLFAAVFGVALTFVLAIVAGRVSGETGITPVGPMGKVTQLAIGIVAPGDPTANLMAANVTGGAASQCGDLLHDLKSGHELGAWPRPLAIVQTLGLAAGALAGSAGYLLLVPDPKKMLLTSEWPAPAVAQWKAVAELFQRGFSTMPPGALGAMIAASVFGLILALAEKAAPPRVRRFMPSPASLGLAFVVPAHNALMIALGGVTAALLARRFPRWSSRFVMVIASGVIAGESLAGVGFALRRMFGG